MSNRNKKSSPEATKGATLGKKAREREERRARAIEREGAQFAAEAQRLIAEGERLKEQVKTDLTGLAERSGPVLVRSELDLQMDALRRVFHHQLRQPLHTPGLRLGRVVRGLKVLEG